jgi:hypothetical protein
MKVQQQVSIQGIQSSSAAWTDSDLFEARHYSHKA